MASRDHKIVRRAQAMSELSRLSGLLAEHLDIELPDVEVTNRDGELAEIQRIENINGLLTRVLQASDVETEPEALSGLTKSALLEKAAEMNVEISKSATKAEIIAAIEHGA
jgi:C4-type Zn-finger protein